MENEAEKTFLLILNFTNHNIVVIIIYNNNKGIAKSVWLRGSPVGVIIAAIINANKILIFIFQVYFLFRTFSPL